MIPNHSRLSLVVALALLVGCSGDDPGPAPRDPEIVVAPVIVANPNPAAPLAGVLSVAADEPVRVELEITDGTTAWSAVAAPEYRTAHDRVPVLGMRPDRTHAVAVTVRNAAGRVSTWPMPLSFTTPPLGADVPPIEVRTAQTGRMEPGVTMFSAFTFDGVCHLVMIDAAGEVVWYLDLAAIPEIGARLSTGTRARNGNLLVLGGTDTLLEVDMLGNVVERWFAAGQAPAPDGYVAVMTDSFHHETLMLPEDGDGDLLVLSSEVRVYPDYPADVVDTAQTVSSADVVGDVIVEFRRDGTIVRETRLLDVLDPYRVAYGSLDPFWDDHYGRPTFDWSHGNAVAIDPADGGYVVSLRHQDAVVKIDRSSGALRWIVGDPGRWEMPYASALLMPLGTPFEWSFHQHAPAFRADGSMLLFDNGNFRAIPPDPFLAFDDSYSRAVAYRVDELAGTVDQVWSYGLPPSVDPAGSFFSFFVSSALPMPETGNVLVCDGGRQVSFAVPRRFVRIAEVTDAEAPEIVFEAVIGTPGDPTPGGVSAYRAFRYPSVYPQ